MQFMSRIIRCKSTKIVIAMLCGLSVLLGTVGSLASPEYLLCTVVGIGGFLAVE
jgi:hypothetical protein